MALFLANAEPSPTARSRKSTITASIRGVATWLGDTPTVARKSYIDPRLISRYESDGRLAGHPQAPPPSCPPPRKPKPPWPRCSPPTRSSQPPLTGSASEGAQLRIRERGGRDAVR